MTRRGKRRRRPRRPLVELVLPSPPATQPALVGGQSEVARLLGQINAEYQAAQRGLSGLSQGSSTHEFITARMENMERAREELVQLVGGDEMEATRLLVQRLEASSEPKEGA